MALLSIPFSQQGTKINIQDSFKKLMIPLSALLLFLLIWELGASQIKTSLGLVPGPIEVSKQFTNLIAEHNEERAKADAFYERQEKRNAKKLAKNPDAKIKIRTYTGKPTFFDQIFTSLGTLLAGFLVATIIAVPIGIVSGLSQTFYNAINPLIQVLNRFPHWPGCRL